MNKMNPKIKADWLKRLRSGEYVQGVGRLKGNETYCCLGVLCDMAAEAGLGEWVNHADRGTVFRAYDHPMMADSFPPRGVANWAGLNDLGGRVPEEAYVRTRDNVLLTRLHELNDKGYTFAQIADIIEEHF